MSRKIKQEGGGGAPAWMTTFADMMSLLLTFFVLLLSFASMDIVKFKNAMGSINEALGYIRPQSEIFQHAPNAAFLDKPMPASVLQSDREIIMKELEEFIAANELKANAEVEDEVRGITLRVKERLLFNPDMADLKYESQPLFGKIAELLKKSSAGLSIEGHTDNLPINGDRFASSWELSAARAYAALHYLQEKKAVDLRRVNIAGFGDIHPLAPNDTPEGRIKNNRLEFIFYEK